MFLDLMVSFKQATSHHTKNVEKVFSFYRYMLLLVKIKLKTLRSEKIRSFWLEIEYYIRKEIDFWMQTGSFSGSSDGKESACSVGDPSSIPGLGRSPGEGNDKPLQCSYLENPTDGRTLQTLWSHKESDKTEQLQFEIPSDFLFSFNLFPSECFLILYVMENTMHCRIM